MISQKIKLIIETYEDEVYLGHTEIDLSKDIKKSIKYWKKFAKKNKDSK